MTNPSLPEAFDDADYPAYAMGSAAEMLGVTPAFLRTLGALGLLDPGRSEGGHRRYSRDELRIASRARDLVAEGLSLIAACRIIALEQQLAAARVEIAALQARLDGQDIPPKTDGSSR